ncbi:hypothetical protein [Paraburkholderia sp. SUR17]|uniref:hypothetical protein n=1 Tax=Paraburkholderia sp. SUR17 TaxID=3034358 RepID=UPI002407CDC6|nr:hypothetical protein [Paraburkholderia sp. SUR17]WEY37756.1 hypothetical protein P2869_11780 [Paraburkholderia sp. SUR17]
MEAMWEYRWQFVEDGYWGGVKETNFWMTDGEAERWWAYGRDGTRRLDETRRDRNELGIDYAATCTGASRMWEK